MARAMLRFLVTGLLALTIAGHVKKGVAETSTDMQVARGSLLGVWRGSYICAQGETGVEVSFDRLGDDGTVTGSFRFFNLPNRNNAASGEYTLVGRLDGQELTLTPGTWLQQAPGYSAVGFNATFAFPGVTSIVGAVAFPGCGQISMSKIGGYQQATIVPSTAAPSELPPADPSSSARADIPSGYPDYSFTCKDSGDQGEYLIKIYLKQSMVIVHQTSPAACTLTYQNGVYANPYGQGEICSIVSGGLSGRQEVNISATHYTTKVFYDTGITPWTSLDFKTGVLKSGSGQGDVSVAYCQRARS